MRKKVALLKIGTKNVSFLGAKRVYNGNMGEIEQIVRLFVKTDCEITILDSDPKKQLEKIQAAKNHFNYAYFDYKIINDLNVGLDAVNADILVVIGGTTNFFGGNDVSNVLGAYTYINSFPGKVLYFYSDPLCPPTKKIGHSRVKSINTALEVELSKPMSLVTCEKVFSKDRKPWKSKNCINEFDHVFHFEFSKSCIFNAKLPELINLSKEDKTHDLIYGGFFRGGARRDQMKKYFFDVPYKAAFFGGIELDAFKFKPNEVQEHPLFIDERGDWNYFKGMTNTALCTLIFAEEAYQDSIVTMRVYYSVLSRTVVFVENSYDSKHDLFKKDFFYINSKEELAEKIQKLKTLTQAEYDRLLDYQYKCLITSEADYYKEFGEILNSL